MKYAYRPREVFVGLHDVDDQINALLQTNQGLHVVVGAEIAQQSDSVDKQVLHVLSTRDKQWNQG